MQLPQRCEKTKMTQRDKDGIKNVYNETKKGTNDAQMNVKWLDEQNNHKLSMACIVAVLCCFSSCVTF